MTDRITGPEQDFVNLQKELQLQLPPPPCPPSTHAWNVSPKPSDMLSSFQGLFRPVAATGSDMLHPTFGTG